jgi:hypothetical protein
MKTAASGYVQTTTTGLKKVFTGQKKNIDIGSASISQQQSLKSVNAEIAKQEKIINAIQRKRDVAFQREFTGQVRGRKAEIDQMRKYASVSEKLSQAQTKQERKLGRLIGEREVIKYPTAAADVYAQSQQKINKKIEQGVKSAVQYQKDTDKLDRTKRRLMKSQQGVARQQSFINSRFGKFSIIMSGLAATLFVWQTVSRVIRQVVGLGTKLEESYAKVADKLELSTQQLQQFQQQARETAKQGFVDASEFIDIAAALQEFGFSAEDAINTVNAAVERERDILAGTANRELKEFVGLWKEIALTSFDASKGSFIGLLRGINTELRRMADAESGTELLKEGGKGYAKFIIGIHKRMNPVVIALKKINEELVKSGHIIDLFGVIPATLGKGEGGYEDFDTINASIKSTDKSAKQLFKTLEDIKEVIKNMPSIFKDAAKFFGRMLPQQREEALEDIENRINILSRIQNEAEKPIFSGGQLEAYRQSLEFGLQQKETAPILQSHKEIFTQLGVMSDYYYQQRSKAINQAYNDDLVRLEEYSVEARKLLKEKEQFNLDQQRISAGQKIFAQYYKDIGTMSDKYYENEIKKIDMKQRLDVTALEAAGAADAKMIAQRIANREKYLLAIQKTISDATKLTKDQAAALEKIFKETGYYSPDLQRYEEVTSSIELNRMLRQTRGAGPFAAISEQGEELQRIRELLGATEELERFDKKYQLRLQGWEQYYESEKRLHENHIDYLEKRELKIAEILTLQGLDPDKAADISATRARATLDKDLTGRREAWSMYYSEVGKFSDEHYLDEMQKIEDMANVIRENVGPAAAAEFEARQTAQLNIRDLMGSEDPIHGLAARIKQVQLDAKTGAETAYGYIVEMVEGSKDILSDELFSLMQDGFTSVQDIFEDLGDAFKRMIDRMVSDFLAAQFNQLIFGQLAGAGGIGGSSLGTGGGLLGGLFDLVLGGLTGGAAVPAMGNAIVGPEFALFAKGAAFANGTIIDKPTLFPFANGTGLMGEAGPEAIMPLTRTASGELGVKTSGDGRTTEVKNTFHINVSAPDGNISKQSMNLGQTIAASVRRNS